MSCAFGMEACKQYYNTKYVRLPDPVSYTHLDVYKRQILEISQQRSDSSSHLQVIHSVTSSIL